MFTQDVHFVESKEQMSHDVDDVDILGFDITAQKVIFDDEHGCPEDSNDKPEGGTD